MAGFDDVTMSWDGKTYTVPADRVMRLVAKVEDVLIGDSGESALDVLMNKRPTARISEAFEVALRYAGAPVAPGEVYLSIMQGLALSNPNHLEHTMRAVMALLELLAPPVHEAIFAHADGGAPAKK